MLLRQATLRGVQEGRITLAFRRWRRPTVRAGGTLLTSTGLVAIDAVDEVDLAGITEAEARAAGSSSLAALRAALEKRTEGSVYRIALRHAGPDPRIALRQRVAESREELDELRARLDRLDHASKVGPWTQPVLSLLQRRGAVRAADLCAQVGMEKDRFKANVRKLKGLGLTESLGVGYRLSPRGEAVLRFLRKRGDT